MSAAPDVLSPAKLGPVTLRNRVIKAATFEARTPRALVSDDLIAFLRAIDAATPELAVPSDRATGASFDVCPAGP